MSQLNLYTVWDRRFFRLEPGADGRWQAAARWDGGDVECFAVDPARPDRILVGTRDAGVFTSDDAGETFAGCTALPREGYPPLEGEAAAAKSQEAQDREQAAMAAGPAVSALAVAPPGDGPNAGVVYAGTEPSRLYRSDDGGGVWEPMDAMLALDSRPTWRFPPRPWTSHVRWIAIAPDRPAHLYVGIELGGVLRSTDGGTTWDDQHPQAHDDCHQLATHPDAAERVYEAAGGGAAISRDYGDTWSRPHDGLTRRYVWSAAVDAEDPDRWYVAGAPSAHNAHHIDNQADAHIFRRQEDEPWETLDGGLPAPSQQLWTALAAHPHRGGCLLAARRDGRIFTTEDGGEAWQELALSGVPSGGELSRLTAVVR